jgi:tRNA(fMet)-specific endonuclease VapC
MFLLDTNTCIYIIKKNPISVVEKIKTFEPYQIKVSSITVAELEYGASKSQFIENNRIVLLKFLSSFEILPFDEQDAEYFGRIRAYLEKSGKVIGPYDMQIASQALCKDLILVTNNTGEFQRIPNLNLENWTIEKI